METDNADRGGVGYSQGQSVLTTYPAGSDEAAEADEMLYWRGMGDRWRKLKETFCRL